MYPVKYLFANRLPHNLIEGVTNVKTQQLKRVSVRLPDKRAEPFGLSLIFCFFCIKYTVVETPNRVK